jgi:hypothetical protein
MVGNIRAIGITANNMGMANFYKIENPAGGKEYGTKARGSNGPMRLRVLLHKIILYESSPVK